MLVGLDLTIRPIDIQLEPVPNGEDQSQELHVVIAYGVILPGPGGQAMAAPIGVVRVPLNKGLTEQLGQKLTEAAEDLKAESKVDIVTATDLSGVEKLAEFDQGLRKG